MDTRFICYTRTDFFMERNKKLPIIKCLTLSRFFAYKYNSETNL